MTYPGPWIQPDSYWLTRSSTYGAEFWTRSMVWIPSQEGGASAEAARYADMWTVDAGAWAAYVDGDAWASAATTEGHVGTLAYHETNVSYPNPLPGVSQQMFMRMPFAQIVADTSETGGGTVPPEAVPEGATVEYESASGTYGSTYRYTINTYLNTTSNTHALESQRIGYIAGSSLYGASSYPGAYWRSWPSVTPNDYRTTTQIESSSSTLSLTAYWSTSSLTGVIDSALDIYTLYLFRNASNVTTAPTVERLYTPPRYRFIYPGDAPPGMWNVRQRQTATGNTGGWPLRQRNNGGATGAWSLRQRQTGN